MIYFASILYTSDDTHSIYDSTWLSNWGSILECSAIRGKSSKSSSLHYLELFFTFFFISSGHALAATISTTSFSPPLCLPKSPLNFQLSLLRLYHHLPHFLNRITTPPPPSPFLLFSKWTMEASLFWTQQENGRRRRRKVVKRTDLRDVLA